MTDSYVKQGDCLALMQEIPTGSVDMILADPPYGRTRNGWDQVIDIDKMFAEYKRVIKDNGCICVFSQMPYGADLITKNRKLFRYEIIWRKNNAAGFLNANRMPLRAHENILVFYKKLPTYNPQKRQGKPYRCRTHSVTSNYGCYHRTVTDNPLGLRYPLDVIDFSSANKRGIVHPTQKPVDLLEYLIKTYTNPGDVVLDPCMGSGSTCIAAKNTGRRYIGFELDPGYYELAKQRIQEAV